MTLACLICTLAFLFCPVAFAQLPSVHHVEEEVRFSVGDVQIAGTLTLPDRTGEFPLMILISGGYPDNRDAELLGFRPFRVMADHFARHGFATFRYDDRGVAQSTGKHVWQYTIEQLAEDVLKAIDILKSHPNIDDTRIGLCGHSRGAIMSPLIASKSGDVAFIIYLGGMGMTGKEQWLAYRKIEAAHSGKSEEEIENLLRFEEEIIETALTGGDLASLREEMRKRAKHDFDRLPQTSKEEYKDFEAYMQLSSYGVLQAFIETPFGIHLMTYTPVPYLEKFARPIFIVFGESDISMPRDIHEPGIVSALKKAGNQRVSITTIPSANHSFTPEYRQGMTFVPDFLETLTRWLSEHIPQGS